MLSMLQVASRGRLWAQQGLFVQQPAMAAAEEVTSLSVAVTVVAAAVAVLLQVTRREHR